MNKLNASRANLQQQLDIAAQALTWLRHSLQQSESINLHQLSTANYDALEALSSRYGRFVDILINKLFRALDWYELLEPGSLIDVLNRAEKRGITTAETGREMKELRNKIVHEYDPAVVSELAEDIIKYANIAVKIHLKLLNYLAETHEIYGKSD